MNFSIPLTLGFADIGEKQFLTISP